jgi:hypothetical protein
VADRYENVDKDLSSVEDREFYELTQTLLYDESGWLDSSRQFYRVMTVPMLYMK